MDFRVYITKYLQQQWFWESRLGSLDLNLPKVIKINGWKYNWALAVQDIRVNTRRDQITIMTDLLDIIKQPQRLTHILYRSNMSYGQLVKYLNDMIEMGMAEEHRQPFRAFMITSKGKLFLDMIDKKPSYSSPKRV